LVFFFIIRCQQCGTVVRFPRYNHPEKLLETRTGRCGEWANCFYLCLRAVDIDARYVLDWTDHVWCEVFSTSQNRWLHADPCENALDKPLIYEHGWGKKLTYIIAFSKYECVDVTWRYSTKHNQVQNARHLCDENWLALYTEKMSNDRMGELSFSRPLWHQMKLRRINEIIELFTPRTVKDGEDVGRQSGSLQWRLSRSETGTQVLLFLCFKISI
jgi:peptide-N4-(N-acetyl-beta-glucosaminyl)asparagine amidase